MGAQNGPANPDPVLKGCRPGGTPALTLSSRRNFLWPPGSGPTISILAMRSAGLRALRAHGRYSKLASWLFGSLRELSLINTTSHDGWRRTKSAQQIARNRLVQKTRWWASVADCRLFGDRTHRRHSHRFWCNPNEIHSGFRLHLSEARDCKRCL